MSSVSQNRVGPDGVASTPTTFQVQGVYLQANNVKNKSNQPYLYDITSMVAYFSVNENLESPGIEVLLAIGDTSNLMEKLKLSGNEQIAIVVNRKEPSKQKKGFTITVRIAEIFNYKRLKPGMSTFNLRCVSEHMYINNLKLLKTPFSGTPIEVIKYISKSILNLKVDTSTGAKNIISGVFPNVRPLQGIEWLLRQSFDDSTPFFYYQTLADSGKMHCKSYKHCLNEDVYDTYVYAPFIDTDIALETSEGYEYERKNIRDISSDYHQGKFLSAYNGAYASSLHTIDIAEKKYQKTSYKYSGSELKLNRHIPFSVSERARIEDDSLSEYTGAKSYFIPLNSMAFNDGQNYMSPSPASLPKAMAYLENLNYQKHRIQIAGDFDMAVGKKVKIEIRRAQEETEGSGVDKLQSGVYLVTAIEHTFDKGFYQHLTIQKDSSEVDLDATK